VKRFFFRYRANIAFGRAANVKATFCNGEGCLLFVVRCSLPQAQSKSFGKPVFGRANALSGGFLQALPVSIIRKAGRTFKIIST
jgi:hypothetical protein